jgi:hypothetical protein
MMPIPRNNNQTINNANNIKAKKIGKLHKGENSSIKYYQQQDSDGDASTIGKQSKSQCSSVTVTKIKNSFSTSEINKDNVSVKPTTLHHEENGFSSTPLTKYHVVKLPRNKVSVSSPKTRDNSTNIIKQQENQIPSPYLNPHIALKVHSIRNNGTDNANNNNSVNDISNQLPPPRIDPHIALKVHSVRNNDTDNVNNNNSVDDISSQLPSPHINPHIALKVHNVRNNDTDNTNNNNSVDDISNQLQSPYIDPHIALKVHSVRKNDTDNVNNNNSVDDISNQLPSPRIDPHIALKVHSVQNNDTRNTNNNNSVDDISSQLPSPHINPHIALKVHNIRNNDTDNTNNNKSVDDISNQLQSPRIDPHIALKVHSVQNNDTRNTNNNSVNEISNQRSTRDNSINIVKQQENQFSSVHTDPHIALKVHSSRNNQVSSISYSNTNDDNDRRTRASSFSGTTVRKVKTGDNKGKSFADGPRSTIGSNNGKKGTINRVGVVTIKKQHS